MNWPPLHPDTSKAIAEVLEDVTQIKPKDLIEQVAQKLQEKSKFEPAQFEQYFEECKKQRQVYLLEDRCPKGQDPLAWVPMRYNDETILSTLRTQSEELMADILSREFLADTAGYLGRAVVAFPEISYLQESNEAVLADQMLRAIYLSCSGYAQVIDHGLDDGDAALSFRCKALVAVVRDLMREAVETNAEFLENIFLCCICRAMGAGEAFQKRYGGGIASPEQAVVYAIQNHPEALPSLMRLDEERRALIIAALQASFPTDLLLSAAIAPAHFARVKTSMTTVEGGLKLFFSVLAIEHLVRNRIVNTSNEGVDLVKIGHRCIMALDKYSGPRAFDLLLKKRAEKHQWRLVKEDTFQRAAVRLCCLSGLEDTDAWNAMLLSMENLSDAEQEILKVELGRKDGIADVPAVVLSGAKNFMARAKGNASVGIDKALKILCKVLEGASRNFDSNLNLKTVLLSLDGLSTFAREYCSGGSSFEDTPFALEDTPSGEVRVKVAGYD